MSAKFITAILMIAATITTFAAAPVRADSDDVKRVLRTAAGLYIAGRLIQEFQNNGGKIEVHGSHRHKYYRYNQHGYRYGHKPRQYGRAPLPRHCVVQVNSRYTKYALGSMCLRHNYRAAHKLPKSCSMKLGRHTNRWGYSLRCLRNKGYRLAGRH